VQIVQAVQHVASSLPVVPAPLLNGSPLHVWESQGFATQLAAVSVVSLPVKPELQKHAYPVFGAAMSAQVAPVPQGLLAQPSVSAAGARAVS
jgi:hypothetical protein